MCDTFISVSKQLDLWQIFKPVIHFENNIATVKSLIGGNIKVDGFIWTIIIKSCVIALKSVDKISLNILCWWSKQGHPLFLLWCQKSHLRRISLKNVNSWLCNVLTNMSAMFFNQSSIINRPPNTFAVTIELCHYWLKKPLMQKLLRLSSSHR